jgi:hypothetical protein
MLAPAVTEHYIEETGEFVSADDPRANQDNKQVLI